MKYCRFVAEEGAKFGLVTERDGDQWITGILPFPWSLESEAVECPARLLKDVKLLIPVAPSKIVCVGRNYRDHARELGNEVPAEPLLFFKPLSSLLASGDPIELPAISDRVDFEGELAVVISRPARNLVAGDDLGGYIHGYTLANDVTARDLQKKDGQWTRAKGFDTFCPVGPIVNTSLPVKGGLTIQTHVNGQLRQDGTTNDLIFSLAALLEYITKFMTLEPGDLLLTGTPAGVGPLSVGDRVEVSVAGLGVLSNPVIAERR